MAGAGLLSGGDPPIAHRAGWGALNAVLALLRAFGGGLVAPVFPHHQTQLQHGLFDAAAVPGTLPDQALDGFLARGRQRPIPQRVRGFRGPFWRA